MKIFLCSSLKNREINKNIVDALEKIGHKVHFPERDTPQENSFEIYLKNKKAIEECDVFLAVVGDHYGNDWTFEVGFVSALNKKIICLGDVNKDDKMSWGAIKEKAEKPNSIDEVLKILGE